LWVPMPPGAWPFVYCECCELSGRGLCDWSIPSSEESYRVVCVCVCVRERERERSRNLVDEASWNQVELLWHKKIHL
jgi:hypothetical protein